MGLKAISHLIPHFGKLILFEYVRYTPVVDLDTRIRGEHLTTHQKLISKKNTDMNKIKIACFVSLLMKLRSHDTCNQGNKY